MYGGKGHFPELEMETKDDVTEYVEEADNEFDENDVTEVQTTRSENYDMAAMMDMAVDNREKKNGKCAPVKRKRRN